MYFKGREEERKEVWVGGREGKREGGKKEDAVGEFP